jgi:cell cycle checkpoint control protein RAD9A
VPDSENASQREVGGGVDAPSRPWGREAPNDAATTVLNDNDDWAHDEFVEATPPEKRQRQ